MLKKLWLYFLFLFPYCGQAAHLVGGEITYKCLGNHDYEITLIIYRDCFSSGAPFDPLASVTVHDINGNVIRNLKVPLGTSEKLPLTTPNNCGRIFNIACTEKGVYKTVVNLPPTPGGYSVTHQRCCRNITISNIPQPDTRGSTYTVSIPGNDISCNSSPAFDSVPPVALCLNQKFRLDMSATDADGDSLSYELCQLLHGGGQNPGTGPNSPAPDTAEAPPYPIVPFGFGHTFDNPITSSPQININPVSGIITGRPTRIGQYVFAVCVKEFRNGQLLSTVRRDFQFNVTSSCSATISLVETQDDNPSTLCIGKTLSFTNISKGATTYHWNFGDPFTENDTSTLFNPTYTYSDTGVYIVTLIANPGSNCADTNSWPFRVFYPINFQPTYAGDVCFQTHSLDFQIQKQFTNSASYLWDFGTNTSLGQFSTLKNPSGVVFQQSGSYYVSATVTDCECEGTFSDSVHIYPYPTLIHNVPEVKFCAPGTIQFTDSSLAYGRVKHLWYFGDGDSSTEKNPSHTYTRPGVYNVEHSLVTLQGCQDSLYESFPRQVEVYPVPKANIDVTPVLTTIYDPLVKVEARDSAAIQSRTFLSDGRILENITGKNIRFDDTGTFSITHIAFNEQGCTDTVVTSVRIDAPLDFYVPNTFTPNGDGINDEFTLSVNGTDKFYMRVFNRWGELVYESGDVNRGWNGKIRNVADAAPDGIYTYRIRVQTVKNTRDIVLNGTINLIR